MNTYHVKFILGRSSDIRIIASSVTAESDKDAWKQIKETQDFFLRNGFDHANTCEYRQLLDRDGYRY